MYKVDSMHDIDGVEIKKGDFVQLVEGKAPYINGAMKKGYVFKVAYMENRPFGNDRDYHVAFLTSKGGNGNIYSSGCTSDEIRKVNYDLKKRKIIETKTTQLEETK